VSVRDLRNGRLPEGAEGVDDPRARDDLLSSRILDCRNLPEIFDALRVDLRDEDELFQKAFASEREWRGRGEGWQEATRGFFTDCAYVGRFWLKHLFVFVTLTELV
jgi:hypothetical protein